MNSSAGSVKVEALLEHLDWVRGLARAVAGDAQADDLTQETYLQAVRHPPAGAAAIRPWLARVLRNLNAARFRSESRRATRDQRAAGSRSGFDAMTPDHIMARAEAQRAVVEALFSLDERSRQLLILRYFEELMPAEIARRLGATPGQIRSQLHRALQRLREKLERAWGEERMGVALATVIGEAERTVPTSTLLWPAAALVLLSIAGSLAWRLWSSSDAMSLTQATQAEGLQGAADATLLDTAMAMLPTVTRSPAHFAEASDTEVVLTGRCVRDEDGAPIEGVVISAHALPCRLGRPGPDCTWHAPMESRSAADGGFRFAFQPPAERFWIVTVSAGRLTRHAYFDGILADALDLGEIRLQRGVELRGTVLDENEQPVASARVRLAGLPMAIQHRFQVRDFLEAVSDETGAFVMPEPIPVGSWRLDIQSLGHLRLEPVHCIVAALEEPASIPVRVKIMPSIAGICLDAAGRPVPDLALRAHPTRRSQKNLSARSDEAGVFRLHARALSDLDGAVQLGSDSLEWQGLGDPPAAEWGDRGVVIRVQPAPRLTVSVVDERGHPVDAFDLYVQRPFVQAGVQVRMVSTHAQLGPFPGGEAQVWLRPGVNGVRIVPHDARWSIPWPLEVDAAAMPEPLEIRLQPSASLDVRVEDSTGAPVAKARVECIFGADSVPTNQRVQGLRDPLAWPDPVPKRFQSYLEQAGVTDAAGAARLQLVRAPGARLLRVHAAEETVELGLEFDPQRTGVTTLRLKQATRLHGRLRSRWLELAGTELLLVTAGAPADGSLTYAPHRLHRLALGTDGSFDEAGIPPGNYDLYLGAQPETIHQAAGAGLGLTPNPCGPPLQRLELAAGEALELSLDAPDHEPGRIDVYCQLDGEPASAYAIEWLQIRDDRVGPSGSVLLDALGAAAVDWIAPGRYAFRLLRLGPDGDRTRTWMHPERHDVRAGESLALRLTWQDRRIRLRFLDADGKTPCASVSLEALVSPSRTVYTLDDGWCELEEIPVSPLEVQVRSDRNDRAWSARISWAPEERLVERVLIRPE
jgi:RNA polymerase sigma-70 factor (ECF subfamily)